MANVKTIKIGDKEVTFKATASVTRQYRVMYGKDIIQDMQKVAEEIDKNGKNDKKGESTIGVNTLTVFEQVAHCMAKCADPSGVANDINDWLDDFGFFSIYEIMPVIMELWSANLESTVESKKNLNRLNEK